MRVFSFNWSWLLTITVSAVLGAAHGNGNGGGQHEPTKKPNFVFIMSDDQDKHLGSVNYQPAVHRHFAKEGTAFENHFCTMSQCCPSRVSILTGKHGHNTNVTDVVPPYGGYPVFAERGFNDDYLPVWLQGAGWNTYYVGKFMNSHSSVNYNKPYPGGFNGTDFLIEPNVYIYENASFQRNKEPPKWYPKGYNTDLVAEKSIAYLEDAAKDKSRPFFMFVMPIGPHSQTWIVNDTSPEPVFEPPIPAERHKHLYEGVKVPRSESFNPKTPGEVSYLKTLPRLNDTVVEYLDEYYRLRLASLAAVDDLIDGMMAKLKELDLLDNTYVIYTSDNGFHIGQHRLQAGKTLCYEEDVSIPFYIRGPGVAKGSSVHHPTAHVDLAPTIFDLLNIPLRDDFDGTPMPVLDQSRPQKYESVNIEFWGGTPPFAEGGYGHAQEIVNNTYKTVRIIGSGYNLMYSAWCTNEYELYDMLEDPAQMHNLYKQPGYLFGHAIDKVTSRLNGLMMVMKGCKGKSCTAPWKTLHPKGDVETIRDALAPEYDTFYEDQMPQVFFDGCAKGYILELEGPQNPAVFGENNTYGYRRGTNWMDWS